MFDTVNFLANVWPFVLLKKIVKYAKLYVLMKVYLTINQMIGKKIIITYFFNKTNG